MDYEAFEYDFYFAAFFETLQSRIFVFLRINYLNVPSILTMWLSYVADGMPPCNGDLGLDMQTLAVIYSLPYFANFAKNGVYQAANAY